jgi:hypothetical protein
MLFIMEAEEPKGGRSVPPDELPEKFQLSAA